MASSSIPAGAHGDPTRRDFLMVATGAMAAVGAIATAWPFINNLNPAADTLALASIEVNVKPIAVGQAITVKWRGKPVFIRHRTPEEIKEAEAVKLVRAARSGDRQRARHRHRQEGAAGVADRGRRLHPSRLRAARHQAGRSARRVRRLVLPLPRLAVRHVGTHPQRPRAQEPAVPDYLFSSDTLVKIG